MTQNPLTAPTKPQRISAPHLPLRDLELASGLLDQRGVSRPTSTLGWSIPNYQRFAGTPLALPPGPREPHLPESLAAAFRKALADCECSRPLASLGLLFGWYGALKAALDPSWAWSPSQDGRECAFMVFESSVLDLPPWTPAQARELSRLCTAGYEWFKNQPLPPLPSLTLDPSDAAGIALWQHQDLLFLAGSVLGTGLGILPDCDEGSAPKRRRLREQWAEVQALVWGATFHWPTTSQEERDLLAATLPLALSAVYQALRNEIAKVDRGCLRFVPKPPEALLPAAKQAMMRFGRFRKR